jgi:hypothetical protein
LELELELELEREWEWEWELELDSVLGSAQAWATPPSQNPGSQLPIHPSRRIL